MNDKTEFKVKITETRVTTKTITLSYEEGKIESQLGAEKYCKEALDNIGFEEISVYTSCDQDEYELTFNGKNEWEFEDD